jgi:spermidine/putrescine transport system ATP-binding protein
VDGATAVLDSAPGERLVVPDAEGAVVGAPLDLTVRPEKIVISTGAPSPEWCALRGRVNEVIYLGTSTQYAVTTADGTELTVFVQNSSDSRDVAEREAEVWLGWRPEHSLALAGSLSARERTSEPTAP